MHTAVASDAPEDTRRFLTPTDLEKQKRAHVMVSENRFTNLVDNASD